MNKVRLLVLDDYEGELSTAPAMDRLRQLAEVNILKRKSYSFVTQQLAYFFSLILISLPSSSI